MADSKNIIEKNKALIAERRAMTIEEVKEKYSLYDPAGAFYPENKITSEVRITLLASIEELKKAFYLLDIATKQYINDKK